MKKDRGGIRMEGIYNAMPGVLNSGMIEEVFGWKGFTTVATGGGGADKIEEVFGWKGFTTCYLPKYPH
jgi:hypothetical protein